MAIDAQFRMDFIDICNSFRFHQKTQLKIQL
jgi:hypothetical protein